MRIQTPDNKTPSRGSPSHRHGIMLSLLIFAMAPVCGCMLDISELPGLPTDTVCEPIPEGCGPDGISDLLIPDCPFNLVCFRFACGRHDLCYARCERTRSACDRIFGEDLLGLCLTDFVSGDPRLGECLTLAYIYWQAVIRFGGVYFDICCPDVVVAKSPILNETAARTIACPFEDLDDDLLPDEWERATGCDPNDGGDALIDPDGDGFNNLEEFVNGTEPADAASVPVAVR